MAEPFRLDSVGIDLSNRLQSYQTVDASPSAGSETIIATLSLSNFSEMQLAKGVLLMGWAAFTVGTSGANANLKIRQTNVSGSTKAASGATTAGIAAAALATLDCSGFDSGAGVGTYVLTLTIGSGAATSTVSACQITAFLI